jgi:hypothetical protein
MVTAGTGMYLLQQLMTLISEDTPHEYASGPTLVELAVDEDKRLGSVGDAPSFYLFGRELPFDHPLEDGEMQVGILKVYFRWLIDYHDLRPELLGWLLAFFSYGRLMLITREDLMGNWAMTGCRLRKHISRLVIVAQHMVQLEVVELSLQISYGLEIHRHLQVNAVLVLHDLSHDQF